MSQAIVTEAQMSAIASRAVNDETRALMSTGATLTYEQADEIGDSGMQWVRERLGLTVDTSDTDVISLRPVSR